jgi:hypothetical protein
MTVAIEFPVEGVANGTANHLQNLGYELTEVEAEDGEDKRLVVSGYDE